MPISVTWQQERDFVEMLFENSLEKTLDYIAYKFDPEDVFTEAELIDWAESNGFVREGE
jgi:hypothetical protein